MVIYLKKLFMFLLCLILGLFIYTYKNNITEYILLNYVYKNDFNYDSSNEYKITDEFSYFKLTDNYKPENKKDIFNIIYNAINNGYESFNFYCQNSYETCLDDVKDLTSDYELLSVINNFVHPYNSYNKLNVTINSLGKINIKVQKLYNESTINILNKKIDTVYNELITDNMTDYDKIKIIHDYIIDNSVYDEQRANNLYNDYQGEFSSNIATGPLLQGHGICSGYTDAMKLFLDKMNIPNYKISSENHIWNLVYINNKWLHLDLTWDDPVINNGEISTIDHTYFLIDTNKLLNIEKTEHNFDENIFIEAKKA